MFAEAIENPKEKVSIGLVVGSICFGVGWGLAGLCPGPMYAIIPDANIKVPFYWAIPCIIGFKIAELIQKIGAKLFGHANSNEHSVKG